MRMWTISQIHEEIKLIPHDINVVASEKIN